MNSAAATASATERSRLSRSGQRVEGHGGEVRGRGRDDERVEDLVVAEDGRRRIGAADRVDDGAA